MIRFLNISYLFNVLKICFESSSRYFYQIVDNYEAVEKIKHLKYSINHVLAFLYISFLLLENIFIYVFIGYDLDNPYMVHHVVASFLPKLFLKQGDVLYPNVYVTSVFIYYHLIYEEMPHVEFVMFPDEEDFKTLISLNNKSKVKSKNLI